MSICRLKCEVDEMRICEVGQIILQGYRCPSIGRGIILRNTTAHKPPRPYINFFKQYAVLTTLRVRSSEALP